MRRMLFDTKTVMTPTGDERVSFLVGTTSEPWCPACTGDGEHRPDCPALAAMVAPFAALMDSLDDLARCGCGRMLTMRGDALVHESDLTPACPEDER